MCCAYSCQVPFLQKVQEKSIGIGFIQPFDEEQRRNEVHPLAITVLCLRDRIQDAEQRLLLGRNVFIGEMASLENTERARHIALNHPGSLIIGCGDLMRDTRAPLAWTAINAYVYT